MIQNIPSNTRWMRLCSWLFIILLFFELASCGDDISKNTRDPLDDSVISSIDSMEQLNKIIETSGNRLLIFDFYADWCPPCKELDPILEKIAKEKSSTVTVYKINIDHNKGLANSFRVVGIPHVILFKNKKTVLALNGLYPKNMYLQIVERFSAATEP
jgi:thioredoxin 1